MQSYYGKETISRYTGEEVDLPRYITVKGKRIYHPNGGLYVFYVDEK
jgi:hypothetical protein